MCVCLCLLFVCLCLRWSLCESLSEFASRGVRTLAHDQIDEALREGGEVRLASHLKPPLSAEHQSEGRVACEFNGNSQSDTPCNCE